MMGNRIESRKEFIHLKRKELSQVTRHDGMTKPDPEVTQLPTSSGSNNISMTTCGSRVLQAYLGRLRGGEQTEGVVMERPTARMSCEAAGRG